MISFREARAHVETIDPLTWEEVPLSGLLGRILSEDVYARCNCPSVDASLKDGYAVISADVAAASPKSPVDMKLLGTVAAGEETTLCLTPGTAVKVLSGSRIPEGADAVLAGEFAEEREGIVHAAAPTWAGRNILPCGGDVSRGEKIFPSGTCVTPRGMGLLAAAGIRRARVHNRPRTAVLATGSELVLPGADLEKGQVFASNQVTLTAELRSQGIPVSTYLLKDDPGQILHTLDEILPLHDAIITSGGALDGERDFVIAALETLGMQTVFKRVRMGPGKGISMGRCKNCLIFALPGGPPSNYIAFVLLACPGIRRLGGHLDPFPPVLEAILTEDVSGQSDWTQFVFARLEGGGPERLARPVSQMRRLEKIAIADGLIEIPQGTARIEAGSPVRVHLLPGTFLFENGAVFA